MKENQHRKLAAILFADIVGYTALMQKGEASAMSILQRFEEVIQKAVNKHQGEIIKSYGDGSLLLFPSTVNALQCGYEMQIAFRESPIVPLRIGIHVGEIIRKGQDIFGNGVNIASRIESMGVAGAILLSKEAQKKLKNQENFQTKSLGVFEFKNVEEPMEVFALSNEGFAIPDKENIKGKIKTPIPKTNKWLLPIVIGAILLGILGYWQWNNANSLILSETNAKEPTQTPLSKEMREKRVAVMVFDNQTGNPDLDVFGLMASDFITQGLMEHTQAKVVSAANVRRASKNGVADKATFAKSTNAAIMIQGRYYLREDKILLHVNIIDALSEEVIFALKPLETDKTDPMPLLEDLQQILLGYWVLRDKRWVGNPPKFDAYQDFVNALEYWQVDQEKTTKLLVDAYQKDTTFYLALLRIAVNYLNFGEKEKADSCLQFLSNKDIQLSEFNQLRIAGIRARIKGDRSAKAKEASVYLEVAQKYEPFWAVNAVQNYEFLNQPTACINAFETYLADFEKLPNARIFQQYIGSYLFSLNKLGQYKKVLQKIAEFEQYRKVEFVFIATQHLRALTRLRKMEEVDSKINEYSQQALQWYEGAHPPPLLYSAVVCNELFLMGETDLLKQYSRKILPTPKAAVEMDFFQWAYIQQNYFKEDLATALELARKWNGDNYQYRHIEIFLLAQMGQLEEAAALRETLESTTDKDAGIIYQRGVSAAVLGEKAKAVELLKLAFEKGYLLRETRYQFDFCLQQLWDYPPFMEFVKPKG